MILDSISPTTHDTGQHPVTVKMSFLNKRCQLTHLSGIATRLATLVRVALRQSITDVATSTHGLSLGRPIDMKNAKDALQPRSIRMNYLYSDDSAKHQRRASVTELLVKPNRGLSTRRTTVRAPSTDVSLLSNLRDRLLPVRIKQRYGRCRRTISGEKRWFTADAFRLLLSVPVSACLSTSSKR